MEPREIIFRIGNDRISLNSSLSIPIEQTNIPYAHMTFKTHQEIFWRVEVIDYEENHKSLRVKVQQYKASDTSNFQNQQLNEWIEQILFEKFDWEQLEPQLATYKKIELRQILTNLESDPFSRAQMSYQAATNSSGKEIAPLPLSLRTITDEYWVSFNDVHFKLGYVSFKKQVRGVYEELDFIIKNEYVLPEFDSVKFWFSKKLKTKRIKVSISVDLRNHEVTGCTATSTQIDQITPELVDSIKYEQALALTKREGITSTDKTLFTHEEIFSRIGMDDAPGNAFNQTEDDILSILREKDNVRNRKQLAYLAGKKQTENHKLYYTLRPNFGFMFLIEERVNNHFVWELLNSNATYVWSFNKAKGGIELQFKRMHEIINSIRTSGRNNYKQSYLSNQQDNDLVFRAISHDNISSNLMDDFLHWRNKLNEQLT